MNNVQISVLIPMYNREHYIIDCVNSVLTQSFQDFEIVIVDDGSTDSSYELCSEKFGHLQNFRLIKNPKNMGEWKTTNRLIKEARGKYIAILHSDDLFLPHALNNLYAVAEATNADVVHCIGRAQSSDGNGSIITPNSKLYPFIHDKNPVQEITVMSDDPHQRLLEWLTGGTFIDPQYNLFNREFMLKNNIFWIGFGGHTLFTFLWLMSAEVYVKVPFFTYVYRSSPDSMSKKQKSPEDVKQAIERHISSVFKTLQYYDYLMDRMDFLKDNDLLKDYIKLHIFFINDNWNIWRTQLYEHGITSEIYQAVKISMEKYFGNSAWLPTFLYHIMHEQQFGRSIESEKLFIESCLASSTRGGAEYYYLSIFYFNYQK